MKGCNCSERDRQWAREIGTGDRRAFEALFRVYYEDLYGFVLQYVHVPEVAEDLVQDLFFDLWNRRKEWAPRTVKTYLYGAARNKALDYLKHRRVERHWAEAEKRREKPPELRPEDTLQYKELTVAMQQAIEALPERRRLIYRLARQQGFTYAEIAAMLDISVNTVEVQIGRALKFLRERLAVFRSLSP